MCSGAMLNAAVGGYASKGCDEKSLLRTLLETLKRDDLLLVDHDRGDTRRAGNFVGGVGGAIGAGYPAGVGATTILKISIKTVT